MLFSVMLDLPAIGVAKSIPVGRVDGEMGAAPRGAESPPVAGATSAAR
ncbi:hypothetical protein [Falsiroseomonas sp.]